MAIACDTAESQATGSYSQLIRALLQNVDSKFQSWSADVNMIPGALLASVDELQELFYETYALLSKYPLEEHSIMWIFYTHALSLRLLMLKQTYVSAWSDRGNSAGSGSGIGSLAGSRRNSTLHLKHLDSNFKEIGAKLLKCSNDITQLVTTVFSGDLDVYRLFQMISTNMQAFQQLYGLMQSSLAVLVVNLEQVEEMTDSKANLHAVARFLVQYYEHAKTVLLRLGVFPPLVECVKVAYKVDLPEVLLP